MLCPNCGANVGDLATLCNNCKGKGIPSPETSEILIEEYQGRKAIPLPTPKTLLILFLPVVWLWLYGIPWPAHRHPPGQLAPDEPVQVAVSAVSPWRIGDKVTVYPLATYSIKARVLLISHFYFSAGADIVPIDLTLGWGPLSDQSIVDQFEFLHVQRFAAWKSEHPPLPFDEVNLHVANVHMIPADPAILKSLRRAWIGDIIQLSGYLVRLLHDDGRQWQSSLTRADTGDGACELMWVEKITID